MLKIKFFTQIMLLLVALFYSSSQIKASVKKIVLEIFANSSKTRWMSQINLKLIQNNKLIIK